MFASPNSLGRPGRTTNYTQRHDDGRWKTKERGDKDLVACNNNRDPSGSFFDKKALSLYN